MAAAQYFDQVQKIFIAFYQRPADPAGLKYWASRVDAAGGDASQVINEFATSAEATALYGTIDASSIGDVVDDIYMALFNVMPDAAGKAFYVDGFNAGTFTAGTIALAVLDGAQNDDLIALNNKVEVANEFTQQVDGRDFTDPAFGSGTAFNATYAGNADADAAREFLATVGSNPATIPSDSAVTDIIKDEIADMGDPILEVDTSGNMLTVGQDTILGTAEGQTFTAPVVQNGMGAQTNTLGSGDVIAGIRDGNKLVVDLTLTTAGALPLGDAISAATNNIQIVELRAQTPIIDIGGIYPNFSHIDAENFNGVEQWWSVNSRSNMQVEDVRTRPEDTTIGMRDTDPFVDFRVYFDPDQLDENIRPEDSQLTLKVADIAAVIPGDLTNVPIDGLKFQLDGVSYTLRSTEIGAATTYAEFVAGLEAAIALQPALATLEVELNADNTITLTDTAGKPFTLGGWFFVNDSVPANGNIVFEQTVGDPTLIDVPISTNVLLDNVGRNSPGGDLDIGSLGAGGIAQFDVTVDRDSWVASMESNSYLDNGGIGLQTEHLETVNFTSTGANGDISVGDLDVGRLDGRVVDGLHDVRVVDGSAFQGEMKVGIHLTDGGGPDDAIARYLDGATAPVDFSYTGSDQADIFDIQVEAAVSDDPDFRMDVDMGKGDDRLILDAPGDLSNISLDGGAGNNTFVTSSDVGYVFGGTPADIAEQTFASFTNFQNYEIEGGAFTFHDFSNMSDVTSVVVAPDFGGGAFLIDLPVADVVVTGKNQTIGTNSNADQNIGFVVAVGADSPELTVTLENTARINGVLTLGVLGVIDESLLTPGSTNDSAVRTLNIESEGARQTSNVIGNIAAERVETINVSGTQALTATLNAAANTAGPAAGVTNLMVDASALTGKFDFTVDSAIVTTVDGNGKTATFKGTAGTTDRVTFDGAITATANTMVTGFETVRFTNSGGDFDASGVSGVTLYDVQSLTANLDLNHLRSTETIQINTDVAGTVANNMLTFSTEAAASSSSLQMNFTLPAGAAENVNFAANGIELEGFTTVNMNLGGRATNNEAYQFDLKFQDNAGLVLGDAGFDFAKVAAKNLVVTGGQASAANLGDSVDLNSLSSTLKVIDFSGYKGSVIAQLEDPMGPLNGPSPSTPTAVTGNTLVKVNGFAMTFDDFDHFLAAENSITTFQFTTDAVSATQDWTINKFFGVNEVGASLSDLTVLDLSALNVNGLVDIIQTQVGGDVHITSNEGLNFEIVLVATNLVDVGLANFQFAV